MFKFNKLIFRGDTTKEIYIDMRNLWIRWICTISSRSHNLWGDSRERWVEKDNERGAYVYWKAFNLGVNWPTQWKEHDRLKIFKIKFHTDGSVQRHKDQLVAKGYSQ